jgi:hypothetical protein
LITSWSNGSHCSTCSTVAPTRDCSLTRRFWCSDCTPSRAIARLTRVRRNNLQADDLSGPVAGTAGNALRYFALDGTDHATHQEQASMIRRYIIWRNNHAYDERLRRIVDRANVSLMQP